MRIWIAPAARMASPVTRASNISVRVFMPPSSSQPGVGRRLAGGRRPPKFRTNRRYADAPLGPGLASRASGRIDAPTSVREGRIRSTSVKDRSGKLIEKARGAVPEGTFAVGAGLVVAAITSYLFVIVAQQGPRARRSTRRSARSGASSSSPGPGLFLPLEQEVGRALAHRRAQGIGGGPLVERAARLGAHPDRRDGGPRPRHLAALRRRAVPRQLAARRQPRDRPRRLLLHAHDARHALGQRALPAVRRDARHRRRRPARRRAACCWRSA